MAPPRRLKDPPDRRRNGATVSSALWRHLSIRFRGSNFQLSARLTGILPGGAVTKRKIEMFQYRQTLVRLRQGDSDREIARSRTMGRKKVAQIREVALARGSLDADAALPDDASRRRP